MTSKKTTVVDLIPNNYKEQPQLIEGKTRVFEEKVAAKVDDLDVFGKFLTIFQVKKILLSLISFKNTFKVCAGLGHHSRSRFIEDFPGNDGCLLRVEAFVFEIS